MIIDQPCTSCELSLERGVKIIAVADIISGLLTTSLLSYLVHFEKSRRYTENTHSEDASKHTITVDGIFSSFFSIHVYITLLVFSIIQVHLGFLLLLGLKKKETYIFNIWLTISGFIMPANGVLPKIYEMIVVYSFTDELKCEAHDKALEEFRQLPYMCNIEIQVYHSPVYGIKDARMVTACRQKQSFVVRHPSNVAETLKQHRQQRPSLSIMAPQNY